MSRLLTLLIYTVFPVASHAQDVVGHLSGTLQGYESTWFVTSSIEGSQSDWSGDESYTLVAILGHTSANTVLETTGALTLTFEMIPEAGGFNVLGREIAYYRQAEILYLSQEDSAEIQVTSAQFDDGRLHVAGKFAGTLGASADFGETVDMSNTRTVEGTFDASLMILE